MPIWTAPEGNVPSFNDAMSRSLQKINDLLLGNGPTGGGAGTQGIPVTISGGSFTLPSTTNADSAGLVASKVLKASAGKLINLSVLNTSGSTLYVQIFNATSLPANGATPSRTPVILPASSNMSWNMTELGSTFATGITVGLSSSATTLTVATAVGWISGDVI